MPDSRRNGKLAHVVFKQLKVALCPSQSAEAAQYSLCSLPVQYKLKVQFYPSTMPSLYFVTVMTYESFDESLYVQKKKKQTVTSVLSNELLGMRAQRCNTFGLTRVLYIIKMMDVVKIVHVARPSCRCAW